MDTLRGIARLARIAREEQTPVFGVAEMVRLRIQSEGRPSVTLIPLGLVGGLSAVAASILLFMAVQFWQFLNSPVMQLVAPLPEIRLW
jgi:hypothetical protein